MKLADIEPGRRYWTRYGSVVEAKSLGPHLSYLDGVMARCVRSDGRLDTAATWWPLSAFDRSFDRRGSA